MNPGLDKDTDVLKKVDLGKRPGKEDLLPPYDKILFTIYDSNDDIHELQKKLMNEKIFSLEELCNADEVITPCAEAIYLMVSKRLEYGSYQQAAKKVENASATLDSKIKDRFIDLEKRFKDNYNQLSKRQENPEACTSLRKEMDSLADEYHSLHQLAKDRNLDIETGVYVTFYNYSIRREKIHEIEKKIDFLNQAYMAFMSTDNPYRELKELGKEVNRRWGKSRLKKDCLEAGYFEGALSLSDLGTEIKWFMDNYGNITKKIQEMDSDFENIKKDNSYLRKVKSPVSLDELRHLRDILDKTDIEKYQKFKGRMYFDETAADYEKKASSLAKRTRKRLDNERDTQQKYKQEVKSYSNPNESKPKKQYSLPMHVGRIDAPDKAYQLHKILTLRNGERDWESRFSNYCAELENIAWGNNIVYLKNIANVMQKAIKNPQEMFNVPSAKKAFELTNKVIKKYQTA